MLTSHFRLDWWENTSCRPWILWLNWPFVLALVSEKGRWSCSQIWEVKWQWHKIPNKTLSRIAISEPDVFITLHLCWSILRPMKKKHQIYLCPIRTDTNQFAIELSSLIPRTLNFGFNCSAKNIITTAIEIKELWWSVYQLHH